MHYGSQNLSLCSLPSREACKPAFLTWVGRASLSKGKQKQLMLCRGFSPEGCTSKAASSKKKKKKLLRQKLPKKGNIIICNFSHSLCLLRASLSCMASSCKLKTDFVFLPDCLIMLRLRSRRKRRSYSYSYYYLLNILLFSPSKQV